MATATQCRTNLRATLLEDSAASLRAKANRCRYTRQHACWIPGEWSQRPTESAITLPALDDYCGETEVVALGCELATANDGSTTSQPLRVLLLNSHGNPVLDTHVHASSTNDENAVEGYKVSANSSCPPPSFFGKHFAPHTLACCSSFAWVIVRSQGGAGGGESEATREASDRGQDCRRTRNSTALQGARDMPLFPG